MAIDGDDRAGATVRALIEADELRMAALSAVADLALPDGWIGAGFVRDAVWNHLHGLSGALPAGDTDVLWFDTEAADEAVDRALEERLRAALPCFDWSVKNQARMHARNGDAPYVSVADAMTHWPETATAVAARLVAGGVEISAPLGLDDLFAMRLRPTLSFTGRKHAIFRQRLASKRWVERYPMLTIVRP